MKRQIKSLLLLGGLLAVAGLAWAVDPEPDIPTPMEVKTLPVRVQALERVTQYSVSATHTGRVVNRRASDLGFDEIAR